MSLREKAISSHRKSNERYDKVFRLHAEEQLEDIIGNIPYETEETEETLIFKVEAMIFLPTIDDDYNHVLSLIKKCIVCGELEFEDFTTLSGLGRLLDSHSRCECSGELYLLPSENAIKELMCQHEGFITVENKH